MVSAGQFNNRVKVIAVAAIGKEFKKSAIIKRVVAAAIAKGHIAKGGLTKPSSSRSITPFSDDRWLIRKDAVKVRSIPLPSGERAVSNISVKVRFGLRGKYQNLSTAFTNGRKSFPPVDSISQWIRAKKERGEFSNVKEKDIRNVAFVIARKISKKGVKHTSFANAFFYKNNGVQATLDKGMAKTTLRLDEIYATSVERSITKMIQL